MDKNNSHFHLQMFSVHGLLRSENMELGSDPDTGGQIKYVIELGKALSEQAGIRQIDLFTRLIQDEKVDKSYSRQVEHVTDKFRIVRIPCGGDAYIRKEMLWPHLNEYIQNTLKFNEEQGITPDIVHGHYPDAGYVAQNLSAIYDIPFIYTGHSLGRTKKKNLVANGVDPKALNREIKIDHRIRTEEKILEKTDMVVASTQHEIEKQYADYNNHTLADYTVIPPGIDVDKFAPFYQDECRTDLEGQEQQFARQCIKQELERFLVAFEKPMILTLCRPDERKNIDGLIEAYGEDKELQLMANLVIFAGIRKDIKDQQGSARDVLTGMLLMMDKYNLYGKMAIPKKHDFETEVPELYRMAAEHGGVFVNPALNEPFGITLLEASASGLPIVATQNGGPKDILENCKSGIMVDPTNSREIADAIKKIITRKETWQAFSKNGIFNTRKQYTWHSHAKTYVDELAKRFNRTPIVSQMTSRIKTRLVNDPATAFTA
jgi:sucrose-phosphate synthase